MPRPRERVYTLDKQKKHLARLSLLSAKRFRFNVRDLQPPEPKANGGWERRLVGHWLSDLSYPIPDVHPDALYILFGQIAAMHHDIPRLLESR